MRFSSDVSKKHNNNLDKLTGINNQLGFFEDAQKLLAQNPAVPFCLIYWNIRKFRTTNDLFGWEAGDRILVQWANTLRETLQNELAVYGRLEHDNFVCCVPEEFLQNSDWTKLGEISYFTGETEYHFYSCCGLYRITDSSVPMTTMLDKARAAMETIKNNYMTLYAWYDDSMWNTLLEEQQMSIEFKTAIAERQFKVYYQPICRATDGLITSAEALVRWQHPTKGMISPGVFIPLFEKNGFISILDRYVWDEVCAMQQNRLDQGLATVPVSVNVSRVEFYNPALCEDIKNIAKKHNISPDLLKIEITESAYADNPVQVQEAIKKLHAYGFTVLMDDFGSGYSSLNMLKDLPIDILKIDMRFLDNLDTSQKATIVLESIIRLAKWMKLSVVSEGVETQKEWEYLKSVECDAVQGYYFYKPMPQEDFITLLDRAAADSTNLLFHSTMEPDDSILNIFNHTNTMESVLFYSMIGGMGLLEVSGNDVEILRVNSGYYETVYNTLPRERNLVNHPFEEPERSFMLEQCRIAKEEAKVQQFQLHHKRTDGVYVWLSVKLRYMGGSPNRSLYLFSLDNIEDQKRAEKQRFISNGNSILLKLFDRVYQLDYSTRTANVLHVEKETIKHPQPEFGFDTFFENLFAVTTGPDREALELIKDKAALDKVLDRKHTNFITVHYADLPGKDTAGTVAYFFKAELPEGGENYLCCVKRNT